VVGEVAVVYTGPVVDVNAQDGIGEGEGGIRSRWMGTPVMLEWGITYGNTGGKVATADCGSGGGGGSGGYCMPAR
jgi:hypothetical protein